MGIAGLLPLLKSICKEKHVSTYSGCTVAVDAYSWIHRGIYGSALDIYLNNPTRKYLDFCITRAKLLLDCKVKPILVFDGDRLPIKAEKEASRHMSRSQARDQVEHALKRGDRSTAWQYANKCVDVTPEMARELIIELQQHGIDYIVAPYEADAQMAYLFHSGMIDAVITEDSDLILFGCRKILFKMQADGTVSEFSMDRITQVKDCDLRNFSLDMIRHMCILSGCDYLDSIPKMGLKTAYKYISAYQTPEKALQAIKSSGSFVVPEDYEKRFQMADMTFLHQRVYNPITKQVISLMPLSSTEDVDFLGAYVQKDIAEGIAIGIIDPIKRIPFDSISKRKYVLDKLNTEILISKKPNVEKENIQPNVSKSRASFKLTRSYSLDNIRNEIKYDNTLLNYFPTPLSRYQRYKKT